MPKKQGCRPTPPNDVKMGGSKKGHFWSFFVKNPKKGGVFLYYPVRRGILGYFYPLEQQGIGYFGGQKMVFLGVKKGVKKGSFFGTWTEYEKKVRNDPQKSPHTPPPRVKNGVIRMLPEHHLVEYYPVPKNRGRSGWRCLLPMKTGLKGYPSKHTFFRFLAFI